MHDGAHVTTIYGKTRKIPFTVILTGTKHSAQKTISDAIANLKDELERDLYVQGLQRKGEFETMSTTQPGTNILQIDYWIVVKCEAEPR